MRTAGVGPLPARLLSFTATAGELVPAWLSDRDRPWLRGLLEEAEAAAGAPIAALAEQWRRSDPDPRAGRRAAIAQHAVLALLRAGAEVPCMAAVRQRLFHLAAAGLPRHAALTAAAREHGLSPDQLAEHLFADLPGERRLRWPEPPPDPSRVLLLANLSLVQGLLRHAISAQLWVRGAARAVLRTAWLHGQGLLVEAADGDGAQLGWRRGHGRGTRSLTALVPLLPWTRRYELRAHCVVLGEAGTLVLATGDPILPGPEPRTYDSQLERDFARAFAAASPEWQLLREPVPVPLAQGLGFPDFELLNRRDGARWLLELAGLRDRSALPRKLALLEHPRCLLCLPRDAIPDGYRGHPRLVPFRRRVDPLLVLAALQRLEAPVTSASACASPSTTRAPCP